MDAWMFGLLIVGAMLGGVGAATTIIILAIWADRHDRQQSNSGDDTEIIRRDYWREWPEHNIRIRTSPLLWN